jgi:hypothetical protein
MVAKPGGFPFKTLSAIPDDLTIDQLQRRTFEIARDIARIEDEIRLGHRRLVKDSAGHTYHYDEKSGKLLASFVAFPPLCP